MTTFAVHLRLIGKLVVDFLLVIIELFLLGVFVLSQCTRLTDGRTDRRTYGFTITNTALHTMQRGKKLLRTCKYYQTLNTISQQSHVNVEIVHELKTVFLRQQKCVLLLCSS